MHGRRRATMPDGLRSRVMAPVYALMISFFAVLLLGGAMHNRGTGDTPPVTSPTPAVTPPQAPAAPAVRIRLVKTGVNEQDHPVQKPATALKGAQVRILAEPEQKLPEQKLTVDGNAEIPMPTSNVPLTVCVQLRPGWTAPNTNSGLQAKFSCWAGIDPRPELNPAGRIDLAVTGPEG